METQVLKGGPMHTERGFVLHEAMPMSDADDQDIVADPGQDTTPAKKQSTYASSLQIEGGLEMTTSRDVLEAMAEGAGPRRVVISLGYAAWGEGQLESELSENAWITVPAQASVIFDTPIEKRYDAALALLGITPAQLMMVGGRA
jgi:putative transcriptional regulator